MTFWNCDIPKECQLVAQSLEATHIFRMQSLLKKNLYNFDQEASFEKCERETCFKQVLNYLTSQSLILSVLDEDYSRERVVYTNLDIRTFLDMHDMTDR